MSFKVCLNGYAGVGKTTFITKYTTDKFREDYLATVGAKIYILTFKTNYGEYTLNIYDCGGQEKFKGLGDCYYINSDALIVIYSADLRSSLKEVDKIKRSFDNISPDKPCITICNKCDIGYKNHKSDYIISVKNDNDFNLIFQDLLRKLTEHKNLIIE